ncbi:MAG: hypothetical protein NTW19_23475 [Planctomycetota bacterium]|nr:hypothetical protein [Planctomycetota bacterium]
MNQRVRIRVAAVLLLVGLLGMISPAAMGLFTRAGEASLLLQSDASITPAEPAEHADSSAPTTPVAPAATAPAPAPAPAPDATSASSFNPTPTTLPALPALSTGMASGGNVAVIRIDGVISDYTYDIVKAMTDRAVKGGATVVVYDIQTPGGARDVAIKISNEIKSVSVAKIAWVNPDAYSAGAIIATACDKIVMAPASRIGDAAPILPGQSLSPTERAKALSPVLAEFRANARRNNYDYALLHAMASLGAEVYLVEETATGRRVCVNQADFRVMVKGETVDAVQGVGSSTPLATGAEPDAGVIGIDLATDAQRGQWRLVKRIHDGRSLLTLNQDEAVEVGLARKLIKDQADLGQYLQAKSVVRVDPGWVDATARVLTLLPVRFLLMLAMMAGIYIELHAPGTGVGAVIALIALIILIVAPLVLGIAQIWHIGLFLIGLVLLVMEMIPPPTFGLLAVVGLLMMFVGLTLSVVPSSGNGPFNLPASDAWSRLQQSILWTLVAYLVSLAGFAVALRYIGTLPMFETMKLTETGDMPSGPATAPVSGDEALGAGRIAVGDVGDAVSELRPSGRAMINDQVVDVMTVGTWLPQGTVVRVVEVSGNRIVVDQV